MSRFEGLAKGKTQYVYGYDPVLDYYFLSRAFANGNWRDYVGVLSHESGTADNLLHFMDKMGVAMPDEHRQDLIDGVPLRDIDNPIVERSEA